jgi:superfamily II DNA helicase RecQ
VLLVQCPTSVLALAQAIGRAGRSGEPAEALLLWDHEDFRLLERLLGESKESHSDLIDLWTLLTAPGNVRENLTRWFGNCEGVES